MLLALLLLGSCSDQGEETELPAPEPLEDPSSRTVAREEEVFQEGASDFISDDRISIVSRSNTYTLKCRKVR